MSYHRRLARNFFLFAMLSFFSFSLVAQVNNDLWENATVKIHSFGMMDFLKEYKDQKTGERVPIADPELSHGTGFLLSQDGLIVTNAHVVRIGDGLSEGITVKLRGLNTVFVAKVVYHDDKNDVAFIKIPLSGWKQHFKLGEKSINAKWRKGQKVYLWGFPSDVTQHDVSLSDGIISREAIVDGAAKIETTAASRPGNSGGPLIDEKNRLVGILQKKYHDATVGLAIPAVVVLSAYAEVLKGGYVKLVEEKMTPQKWEIIEIYARMGYDEMMGDKENISLKIKNLWKIACSSLRNEFPEALVFFAGSFWNDSVRSLEEKNEKNAMAFLRKAMGLVEEAYKIKPTMRENGFVVEIKKLIEAERQKQKKEGQNQLELPQCEEE